jgi:hypothetical protein
MRANSSAPKGHDDGSSMIDPLCYQARAARPADSDAVSALLSASYSTLLTTRYDGDLLQHALPLITKAQPTLLASDTYYEREAHIRHFATMVNP